MSAGIRAEVDALIKAADLDPAEVTAVRYYPHKDHVAFVTRGGVKRVPLGPKATAKKAPAKKAAKKATTTSKS